MITNNFARRHNGPFGEEIKQMLKRSASDSLDTLIDETVPSAIRMKEPLDLPDGMNEYQYLNHLSELASKNKIFKSFIGTGLLQYHPPGCHPEEHP